jgi:hypothetical protein
MMEPLLIFGIAAVLVFAAATARTRLVSTNPGNCPLDRSTSLQLAFETGGNPVQEGRVSDFQKLFRNT